MNYLDYCICSNTTVREAMRKLDSTKPKILFLVDESKLVGALTDGDIRRFILNSGKIDDIVEKAANKNPKYAMNARNAALLYDMQNCVAIPIVDEKLVVKDIFFGKDKHYVPTVNLNIPVVINAGGRGTRLDPFTRVLPKPLIPVGELPIIEHIMQQYKYFSCDEFHVIVNYKKQLMKAYFSENENNYNLTWYDEEKPLGTGGGLSLLKGKLNETFFFTNCDILLQSNYDSMLRFHRDNNNTVTMICAYKNITIPYGVVEMGINGCIEAMKEKPEMSFLTNTGMYIVEPEVLNDIEDDISIGFPDIIEMQKKKGRNIAAYPVSEYEWMDMGQLSELEKMRVKLYGE